MDVTRTCSSAQAGGKVFLRPIAGCQRYCESARIASISILQTVANRLTSMSSATRTEQRSGSLRSDSGVAAVLAGAKSFGSFPLCGSITSSCQRHGMSSSRIEPVQARAQKVTVTEDAIVVELSDGRAISAPLAWYPRLFHATPAERSKWRAIGDGEGIHWPDLDEDIEVDALVAGSPSGESQQSLQRWLESRKKQL